MSVQRYSVGAIGVFKSDDAPWVKATDYASLEATAKMLAEALELCERGHYRVPQVYTALAAAKKAGLL